MGVVKHRFKPSLLLALCLVVLDQELSVLCQHITRGRIEAFPTCVEIVDINPPPYSVVKANKDKVIWFEVTFSKPVYAKDGGNKRVFISPNAGGNIKTMRPADQIRQSSTTPRKWAIKFTIRRPFSNYFGSKYKYVNLNFNAYKIHITTCTFPLERSTW